VIGAPAQLLRFQRLSQIVREDNHVALKSELFSHPLVYAWREGRRESAASGNEDDRGVRPRTLRPEDPLPCVRSLGSAGRDREKEHADTICESDDVPSRHKLFPHVFYDK